MEQAPAEHGLTVREFEVMQFVVRGAKNAQIAETLCISVRTVHKHLENTYRKLGVSNRTAAAMRLIGPQAPAAPDSSDAHGPTCAAQAAPLGGNQG